MRESRQGSRHSSRWSLNRRYGPLTKDCHLVGAIIGSTPYRSPTGKLPSCRTSRRRRIGEATWTVIRHVTDALIRQPRYDVQRFYQVAPLQLSTKAIIIDLDDLIAPENVAERSIDRQAEILITTRQGQCIGFDR